MRRYILYIKMRGYEVAKLKFGISVPKSINMLILKNSAKLFSSPLLSAQIATYIILCKFRLGHSYYNAYLQILAHWLQSLQH